MIASASRERIARQLGSTNIGHAHVKQRRMNRAVTTRAGGTLGDYVPFNFCPRSVMLYVVRRGHQGYAGGQDDVVHLVSTVSRAVALGNAWAFTDRHAELAHALHFDDLSMLSEVPWQHMGTRFWQAVREERQAEFLVRTFFAWDAIEAVGEDRELLLQGVVTTWFLYMTNSFAASDVRRQGFQVRAGTGLSMRPQEICLNLGERP